MPKQGNYIKGKVTQRVFDAAKILLENGSPQTEVAKYMKLSVDVVRLIDHAETFMDYKAAMYERCETARKRRAAAAISAKKAAEAKADQPAPEAKKEYTQPAAQVVEHRQSVTVQATHFMETKLDVLIEQMKLINAKLGAIIDDLYGTGRKDGESA